MIHSRCGSSTATTASTLEGCSNRTLCLSASSHPFPAWARRLKTARPAAIEWRVWLRWRLSCSSRSVTCCFDGCCSSRSCAFARTSSRSWKSSCCGTNSPSSDDARAVRRSRGPTACSWRRPVGSCRAPAGGPSSSHRPRCCAGIGAWWRSDGPMRIESVARRSDGRSESWSSVSRARTRSGDISALSAN